MIKKIIFLSIIPIIIFVLSCAVFSTNNAVADVSSPTVDIGNAVPIIMSVNINSGSNITLTEGTTTVVRATGVAVDNNGCRDLTSVKIAIYAEGQNCASAEDAVNSDVCYFYEDTDPASHSSCTNDSDLSYSASVDFNVYYYANPGNWKTTVTASDSLSSDSEDSSAVSLNSLLSLDVTSSIDYGYIFSGRESEGDYSVTITNTGNRAIDLALSGEELSCISGSIPTDSQEYSLTSFEYGNGTKLSDEDENLDVDLQVPDYNTIPITDVLYWQIDTPSDVSGDCSGNISFTAIEELD